MTAAAVLMTLTLAGFGCKPILDAQNARQAAEEERPSEWIASQPALRSTFQPDGTGQISMEMRSRPGTTVTVRLEPLDSAVTVKQGLQENAANADGWVYYTWQVSRRDTFAYSGTVVFQNSVVDTFEGEYDAY